MLATGDRDGAVPTLAIGDAWAQKVARALRAERRGIVGAWPGTMREARALVIGALSPARLGTIEDAEMQALVRAVYEAARRAWDQVSEPDPEP